MKPEGASLTKIYTTEQGKMARGSRAGRVFAARFIPDSAKSGECETCGARTLRSHRTGILHEDCFTCRYLKMIYGPNIKVRRLQ